MAQIQVLLAEKRTSLAVFRTGAVLLALPISIITVLITTSDFYTVENVWQFFTFLIAVCTALVVMGLYMCVRSWRRVRKVDHRVDFLKMAIQPLDHIIGDLLGDEGNNRRGRD